ncbi:MAG: DNA-3-methyladenine glycosylase I [Acidobacteriota bacterium]|nr:MAG: DNA-3-methyladenine glycosylase I [Acidobacteriota bacterium]
MTRTFPSGSDHRCSWCLSDPIYIDYHDQVWGVPEVDENRLFAKLLLDGAQAGLSWITILRKQEGYYRAFDQFDPMKMAHYDDPKIQVLLQDPGIVRNRQKVAAFVQNARCYLDMKEAGIDFSAFLWEFVEGRTLQNSFDELSDLPAQTRESQAMSTALRQRGFKFVGPTICYAFMQAVGMVNDHLTSCYRWEQLRQID